MGMFEGPPLTAVMLIRNQCHLQLHWKSHSSVQRRRKRRKEIQSLSCERIGHHPMTMIQAHRRYTRSERLSKKGHSLFQIHANVLIYLSHSLIWNLIVIPSTGTLNRWLKESADVSSANGEGWQPCDLIDIKNFLFTIVASVPNLLKSQPSCDSS